MPPFQPTSPCPLLKCQHLFLRFYMNRTVCTRVCAHMAVCACVYMSADMCAFACMYTYSPQLFFYNPTLLISLSTLIISMLLSESVFFSLILFFLNHSEDPFHQCSGLSWISSLLYLKQLPPSLLYF